MKKLILYSLLLFSALSVLAENFDPAACPDLTVRIYPGTGRWRVLHATSGYTQVKSQQSSEPQK